MGDEVLAAEGGRPRTFPELLRDMRERHVFRIAAAYLVAAWVAIQVVATIGPAFDLPDWVLRVVVVLAAAGFFATIAAVAFAGSRRSAEARGIRRAIFAAAIVIAVLGAGTLIAYRSAFATPDPQIAVLPFEDLSPARDKSYFAEGVAEEILSTLSAEKGIRVLGRTSARQINRHADPQAVRKSLGVTHLLEGSARTAGNALRVNVRLVDTSNGSSLWEEEYQGQLADVFAVQDQIATAVVRRLRGTFFTQSVRAATATSVNAYETYLAARALMRTRSEESLSKALELARKVIAADPNYAPGHAIYAELLFLLSDEPTSYGHIPVERARALALPHARKAIQLAPDKAEGHAALGLVVPREQSIEPLRRAIALDPGRAELRVWLGVSFTSLARHDEAYPEIVAAAEAEPLWPVAINRLTQVLSTSGRRQEALEVVTQYLRRGGSKAQAHRFLATIARSTTDLSTAATNDALASRMDSGVPYVKQWMATELALLRLYDRAASAWPHPTQYGRLFVSGQHDQLRGRVAADGAKAWMDPFFDGGLFVLGTARDWNRLAALYRTRTPSFADYCNSDPHSVPLFVMAMRATGDLREANLLLDCARKRVDRELAMKWASPNAEPGRLQFRKASLLGAVGDRSGIDWLEKAVQLGWVGQYYSSKLADWPQFDAFRSDPRYALLQRRIDATIARERAEVLAAN